MHFSTAFVVLPLLAHSAFAVKTCARKYTVKAGDICDGISAAQNVSTYQLSAANTGIIDSECSNLVPGTDICIGYTGEDCSTTHVVQTDDTCEQIASNFNINSTILYMNNPQINADCTNIYIGEVLCTSGTVQAPPAPSGPLPGATVPATAKPANPTVPVSSTAHPAATPSEDSGDGGEEDIPFCDEL